MILVVTHTFFLFYVHPRYIVLPNNDRRITSLATILVLDLVFHWAPLLYVYIRYAPYYRASPWGPHTAAAALFFTTYVLLADPFATYHADPRVGIVATLIAGAAYALLTSAK